MTRVVDLAAIVAETKLDEPLEVHAGDDVFHVHPEMPWDFAVAWAKGDVDGALALIVPDTEVAALRAVVFVDKPSKDTALKRLAAIWNVSPGESRASSRSSKTGGTRSRPTSKRTTTST